MSLNFNGINIGGKENSTTTIDSELSTTSTNPVQNKVITNTFYSNFKVDANDYTVIDDSVQGYNINGFPWKAPSNGLLSFRNTGSTTISGCGVVQANTYAGEIINLYSSNIITYNLVKDSYYYIIRKDTSIEIRFYPVMSSL